MTQREKLIELLLRSDPIRERDLDDDWGDGELDEIADHLLANGVIVPPCKVGDTVYVGVEGTSCVLETKVLAIGVDEDGDFVLNPYEYPDDVFCVSGANIGKTVFLSRAEAEKALAERSEGK